MFLHNFYLKWFFHIKIIIQKYESLSRRHITILKDLSPLKVRKQNIGFY